MNWKQLTDQAQLDGIREASKAPGLKGIAIFKHSTRCSISSTAKSRLERQWDFDEAELPIYYLDLLRHRNISNQIASDFGVYHESPQLLLVKDGEVVYHASHFGIDARDLAKALGQA